ncbi:PREDICTED: putative protease Do-like 12, mitochondrial [Brassica oleracea var. oleracea]|nr:PREDICTED: putative protease Do-like 12, mitochondrial [Brassica oleracea var. oleracea]
MLVRNLRALVPRGFLSSPHSYNVRSNPVTMAGRVVRNLSAILNVGNNDRSTVKKKQNGRMKTKETCPVGLLKNSVVKVFFASRDYSRTRPWETHTERCSGSGFAISGKRILTNAHVVEVLNEHTSVHVKKRGSTIKYKAKVQKIAHECDLAILEIDSQEFWKGMNPLELGGIPPLKKAVFVLGYSGNRIWITKGLVSSFETKKYLHSDTELLRIQIDATIKNGNSGGPVILENKVVGVAYEGSQIQSSLIPTPIVKRFITQLTGDEESDQQAVFCSLGLSYQSIKNAQIRNHFKMSSEMTGSLINKISLWSGAYGILKKNDIILAIDGFRRWVPIANDATVPFWENERISFYYLISMKKPGETSMIKVLRRGKEHEYNINLKPVKPHVRVQQYYKRPSYYIFGGFVFVPNHNLSESEEQHVIISEILEDDINQGYESFKDLQVEKVNKVKVKNLRHLFELIEENGTQNLSIDLEDDKVLVLNYESAKKADSIILKRHNITSAISNDLTRPSN